MTYSSIPSQLENWLRTQKPGDPVSTAGFQVWLQENNSNPNPPCRSLIDQALSRAVRSKRLLRVAPGLFLIQKPGFPLEWPTPSKAMTVWSAQNDEIWLPSCDTAALLLDPSLIISSNSSELKWDIWTSGSSRVLNLGQYVLNLKNVSSRWLNLKGPAGLALRYMQFLGQASVSPEIVEKIRCALGKEEEQILLSYPQIPGWMKERIQRPKRQLWALPKNEMKALIQAVRRDNGNLSLLVESWTQRKNNSFVEYGSGYLWPTSWLELVCACNLTDKTLDSKGESLLFSVMETIALGPLWDEGKDRMAEIGRLWSEMLGRWENIETLSEKLKDHHLSMSIWAGLGQAWSIPSVRKKIVKLDEISYYGSSFLDAFAKSAERLTRGDSFNYMSGILRLLSDPKDWTRYRTTNFLASNVIEALSQMPSSHCSELVIERFSRWMHNVPLVWDDDADKIPQHLLEEAQQRWPLLGKCRLQSHLLKSSHSNLSRQRL